MRKKGEGEEGGDGAGKRGDSFQVFCAGVREERGGQRKTDGRSRLVFVTVGQLGATEASCLSFTAE